MLDFIAVAVISITFVKVIAQHYYYLFVYLTNSESPYCVGVSVHARDIGIGGTSIVFLVLLSGKLTLPQFSRIFA